MFKDILLKQMKVAGVSSYQLASMSDLDQRTINYWMRGARTPSYEGLVKLSKALKVNPSVWFEEEV